MPKIESIKFEDLAGNFQSVQLLSSVNEQGFDTSIVTGVNGSNKSTILFKIVDFSINDRFKSNGKFREQLDFVENPKSNINNSDFNVIAVSGALSDRFPLKRNSGRVTQFDNPDYLYFGQQVASNLLSKRHSLEAVCLYLFDTKLRNRYYKPFFDNLFETVNLLPSMRFKFKTGGLSKQTKEIFAKFDQSCLSLVSSFADGISLVKNNVKLQSKFTYSRKSANFLLDNFHYDTFNALDEVINNRQNSMYVDLNTDVLESKAIDFEVLRLGLALNFIQISDVEVLGRYSNKPYSIFKLSSGEYNLLNNILAIGFAIKDNSIVLIDEPENSLHPQWQIEFMKLLSEAIEGFKDGHVVISTHSPLIVSSGSENSTLIDFSENNHKMNKKDNLFGSSTDKILIDHFGVASTRNYYFADLLQKAVTLFENNKSNTTEYYEVINKLNSLVPSLDKDDPLIELIAALNV